MNIIDRMKDGEKISIGMVHTLSLPGSFDGNYTMKEITERAINDAITLEKAGFEAVMVQNDNDGPFDSSGATIQQISALAIVTKAVRDAIGVSVGVGVCGNSIAGIEIASVIEGVDFVRIPYFVDVRIGSGGIVEPNGGDAVWTRKRIGAEKVKIFADIQIKHTYPLLESISITDSTLWSLANRADAIIVSGTTTGAATSMETIIEAKKASKVPVVVGSGISSKSVFEQYSVCDGAIVGSSIKKNGNLLNPVEYELALEFITASKKV